MLLMVLQIRESEDLKIHENQDQNENPFQLLLMQLQIYETCWSKDTWKSAPKWKTIQLLLMVL